MSPSASTSGWPGSVRSGSTATRPARSTSMPASPASLPARPEAVTPAAQIAVRAATRRPSPSRRSIATESAATSTTVWPASGVDAELLERPRRLPRERLREGGQYAVAGLDEQDARGGRIGRAEVAAQRVVGELRDLPGHLDAGRAGADDHEREPAPAPVGVGLDLGRLERPEHAAADVERAGERLQLRRVLPPLVVAEVGVPRPARDDQGVVGEGCAGGRRSAGCRAAPRDGRGRTRSPPPAATRALRCLRRMSRSGVAISAARSAPVAAW